MYVAIEGIDTAGKSTQIEALKQHFTNAVITKEPGATKIGSKIREIVLSGEIKSKKAEFLLFLADRAEHIQEVVKPNLGKIIISDRSVISGIAYALVQGAITKDELVSLNRFATDDILPEKVFLLNLSEDELKFRLSQKELDGIELRGVEYLLEIQKNIKTAVKMLDLELVEIDAKNSIENITKELIKHIKAEK